MAFSLSYLLQALYLENDSLVNHFYSVYVALKNKHNHLLQDTKGLLNGNSALSGYNGFYAKLPVGSRYSRL